MIHIQYIGVAGTCIHVLKQQTKKCVYDTNKAVLFRTEWTSVYCELKNKQIDCLKSLGYGISLVYTILPYIQDSDYGSYQGHATKLF